MLEFVLREGEWLSQDHTVGNQGKQERASVSVPFTFAFAVLCDGGSVSTWL
jgi:hypothetical protein